MSALRASVRRLIGPRALAFFVALAAFADCGSQSALGGLIFTQVQFDGFVRSGNGSGPVADVEAAFHERRFSAAGDRTIRCRRRIRRLPAR